MVETDVEIMSMSYPKTILEVQELEEEFRRYGLSPNDYLLLTIELKIDIHDNCTKLSKNFEDKMLASMKEVNKLLRSVSQKS